MSKARLYQCVLAALTVIWAVMFALAAYLCLTADSGESHGIGLVLAVMSGWNAVRNGLELAGELLG